MTAALTSRFPASKTICPTMLYAVARKFGKQALAVFTVSDNALTGAGLDSSERERGFNDMITLALDTAVRAVED